MNFRQQAMAALLAVAATAAWGSATSPSALLARLARPTPASTPFVEVRFSRLLTTPLVVAGVLRYQSADALDKQIDHPYVEQMQIRGDDVAVIRDGEATRHFSLKRAPELRGMLSAFGALLSGDQSTLERYFSLSLSEDEAYWTVALTPRDARVGKRLRDIVITGGADSARCLVVTETDGDASVMLLGETSAGALPDVLDLVALERLCRTTAP